MGWEQEDGACGIVWEQSPSGPVRKCQMWWHKLQDGVGSLFDLAPTVYEALRQAGPQGFVTTLQAQDQLGAAWLQSQPAVALSFCWAHFLN